MEQLPRRSQILRRRIVCGIIVYSPWLRYLLFAWFCASFWFFRFGKSAGSPSKLCLVYVALHIYGPCARRIIKKCYRRNCKFYLTKSHSFRHPVVRESTAYPATDLAAKTSSMFACFLWPVSINKFIMLSPRSPTKVCLCPFAGRRPKSFEKVPVEVGDSPASQLTSQSEPPSLLLL